MQKKVKFNHLFVTKKKLLKNQQFVEIQKISIKSEILRTLKIKKCALK